MTPREAAYLALLRGKTKGAEAFLIQWIEKENPAALDISFAKELAYGVIKRKLSLEFFLKKLGNLKIKSKEKTLLFLALYQMTFMDRVPIYAIGNETVNLAKKYVGPKKAGWINALLRKFPALDLSLPKEQDLKSLSYHYSYPTYWIKTLQKRWGQEKTLQLLTIQNQTYLPCIRWKKGNIPCLVKKHPSAVKILYEGELIAAQITEKKWIAPFLEKTYIQNVTPVFLIDQLSKELNGYPSQILDACAAPGGKLLAFHLLFPKAKLYANDRDVKKLKLLQENLVKFQVTATLLKKALEKERVQKVEVAILDAPCSNSGVLGKKPEARWRLTSTEVLQLQKKQKNLLNKIEKWVQPGGQIWYMTCSILPQENEEVVQTWIVGKPWKILRKHLVLPNQKGWDGGFGCALQKEN